MEKGKIMRCVDRKMVPCLELPLEKIFLTKQSRKLLVEGRHPQCAQSCSVQLVACPFSAPPPACGSAQVIRVRPELGWVPEFHF